jgi:hypothetical protein
MCSQNGVNDVDTGKIGGLLMMESDMLDEGNEEIWSLEATSHVHFAT